MATEPASRAARRACLRRLGGLGAAAWSMEAWAAQAAWAGQGVPALRMLASWQLDSGQSEAGILQLRAGLPAQVISRIALPTRAHALLREPGGSFLAVARRPGEWLLRFTRTGRELQRHWIEPDRSFNGHAWLSADGRTLCTSETDLDTAQGLIGVRDARSLEKRAEWPTQGMDPHALLCDAQGHWLVANGGIPTLPESGRAKRELGRMDASLVRLHRDRGHVLGQWRLSDPRLSLRHLALGPGGKVGVALQSEDADDAMRRAAPVLAVFDGQHLELAPQPQALAGYAGDIAALGDDTWVVACPRADALAWWRAGQWLGTTAWPGACALAPAGDRVWTAGAETAGDAALHTMAGTRSPMSGLRIDNHWVRWQAA